MSLDPFDVVTVRKAGRSTPSVGRSRTQEDDDPFAVVQVSRPKALTQGQVKDVSPLKVGAPSFQQFADAGAELPAAPPKKKYDTAFAEDILQRRAKAQPTQPTQPTQPPEPRRLGYQPSKTPYAGDIGDGSLAAQVGRLARTTKAEANRPVEEFQQNVLDVLKTPEYIGRQAIPAITGMAQPFVEGAYNLLGRPDIAEYTRQLQQKIEQASAPQSRVEEVIGGGMRLAGLFAPYIAAGVTAAPLSISAALTGLQSQAKNNTPLVEFLGDKLDSDVLKRIATSKYKTPAEMALDVTLGLTFGSLDNTINAFKNTTSARSALRTIGAEPFVKSGNVIREGIQSGALDPKGMAPLLKEFDKFAQQAKVSASLPLSGAGARAVDVVAGLGSSAAQFGRNVASNVGAEAKLLGSVGNKLAEQAALSGAQVSIPKRSIEPLGDLPTITQEVRSVGSDGFVVLPPQAQTNLAVEKEHLVRMNMEVEPKIQQLAAPHTRAKEGAGLFDGDVSPNALFRFSANTPDEEIRKAAAVRGLVYGQQAQLWYRPAREGDKATSAAFFVYGDGGKDLSPEAITDILAAAKENGIFGATKDGGTLSFLNIKEYTELSDDVFNEKMEAALQAAKDKHNGIIIHQNNIYSEFLNGTPSYIRAIGPTSESLLGARNAIVEATPEYIRYAKAVGADPAVTEQRIAARLAEIDEEITLQRAIETGDEASIQQSLDQRLAKDIGSRVEAQAPTVPPAVVAPVAPTAPVVEAAVEPVKAPLPPLTRPEKGPLFSRAPDFGSGSNEYVINADGIEDGWRVWRDTDSGGARGQWYVTAPRGGQFPLAVWTKKEAEQAALDFINTARERGYVPNPDFGGPIPYGEITSPRQPSQPVTSALAGKTFDIGGALGEGVRALSNAPGGKAQLARVGLGAVGYGMSQAEDERLRITGDALMVAAAYSLVHGKVKQGAKYTGSKIAEELSKFSAGRRALDEISLDIRTDPRIKDVVQRYERERSKLEAIGRELASGVQKRGPVFERVVSDLVDKETIEAGALSTEDMALAVAFAQKIADNSLGLKKVGADIISYDTYLKQGGPNFLPRRYARYEAEDVNDVVVQYKGKTFRIGGEKIRNNLLTREERDALGEIREASYRIADYFGRGARDITTAHLFQTLADIPGVIHPEYVSAVREAAIGADLAKVARTPTKGSRGSPAAAKDALRAADAAKARAKALSEQFKRQGQEYVTLPDTPQLGVLRGAVVRKDAADYLNDLPDFRSTVSQYNKALKYWKTIKTVFNPPTHVANFVANWPVAIMNGLPFTELMTVALPRAYKDIQAYGPATRFLAEAGVLERAALTYGDVPTKGIERDKTVLRSMLKTTRPETRVALEAEGLKPMSRVEEKGRAIAKGFGSLYSTGDAIFRVALFQKLTKNGLGNEEALTKVMKAFPDYGTRSPLLQKVKLVSPFVMYSAKYIPTFLDKIAEQPWRWALVASSWTAIDQASRRKAGAVDEMDLPPNRRFTKAGYLLPGLIQAEALGVKSDQVGERKMIDIARFTPLTALSGSTSPGSPVSAISQNVPNIFQPSGPALDLAAMFRVNADPFSGRPFIKPGDEGLDKLKKWTVGSVEGGRFTPGFAANLALPSFLSYHIPNIIKDLYYGNTSGAKADALGLVGLRPVTIKAGKQAEYALRARDEKISDVNKTLDDDLKVAKNVVLRRKLINNAMEKRARINAAYTKSRQR